LIYVVQSGDTLSGIARRFYGRSTDWHRIVEWNEDRIEDSDRLKPGIKLRLSSDGMDATGRRALREAAEPETSSD
jgi:nucleoid-associated protein YgaU